MPARPFELDRIVLEAVSEDYQSFESVVSKLSRADPAYSKIHEIEQILLTSIANKLVAAYLIHADPPYATEVGASSENIRRFWFCITDEGRKHLGRIHRKQAVLLKPGTP